MGCKKVATVDVENALKRLAYLIDQSVTHSSNILGASTVCCTVLHARDRPVNKTGKDLLSWSLRSDGRRQMISKYIEP